MATSPADAKVFISYRRDDTGHAAARLYDAVAARLGEDQVFMDLDTIALGDDFVEDIDQALGECAVMLALIGPRWLSITNPDGSRRLDDPDDYVRREIQTALERNIPVIPVLVDTDMPPRRSLPEPLAPMRRRNAHSIRLPTFRADTAHLADELNRRLSTMAIGGSSTPDLPGPPKGGYSQVFRGGSRVAPAC